MLHEFHRHLLSIVDMIGGSEITRQGKCVYMYSFIIAKLPK